jgi:flagellar motor switch protein FliN/FliY
MNGRMRSHEHNEMVVEPAAGVFKDMARFYDIPLHVTIEVGRLNLRVRDLLKLCPGAVIELKKSAGEPFEICVNDHRVARGEVVAVDQCAGVRIVEIPKVAGLP